MSRVRTLLDEILGHEIGYPVEAMEKLILCGPEAAEALGEALSKNGRSEDVDPLPLIVVLGEIGGPAAAGPLAGLLAEEGLGETLGVAAAAALGKARSAAPAGPEGGGDWRVRWRRRPAFGWEPAPATPAAPPAQALCPDCGYALLRPLGIQVCPESAYGSAVVQAAVLRRFKASGLLSIPRALDELDADALFSDDEWGEWSERRRERWLFQQGTLEALMLQGLRTLEEGSFRVQEVRRGLGALWGVPQARLESDEDFEAGFFG